MPAGESQERKGNHMTEYFEKYYRLLNRASSSLASPFLLAVRLYWGWQFMQTGWGKLTDIGKVIHFFTDLGIPAPVLTFAYFVSALELEAACFSCSGSARDSLRCPWSSTWPSPTLRRIVRPCSPRLRSRQVHRRSPGYVPGGFPGGACIFGAGWFFARRPGGRPKEGDESGRRPRKPRIGCGRMKRIS